MAASWAMAEPVESAELSASQQDQIVQKFKTIREYAVYEHPDSDAAGLQEALDEETAHAMQGDASSILQLARDIQTYAPRCVEVAEDLYDQNGSIFNVFQAVHSCAREMAKLESQRHWASASGQIIRAMRRVEELLKPFLLLDELPESSLPTTQPRYQGHHVQSVTDESWTRGHPEVSDLPEAIVAGNLTAELQRLEQQLLEQQHKHGNTDHHDIAATLHELGGLSQAAGDLPEAKRYLEESLRMKHSLHGDRDHPGIAATLHQLGRVSQAAGDLPEAKQYLEESLQMRRSLHGDRDHPEIAATLHQLGRVSQDAGDLPVAKRYLEESLRMKRSLHGDRDDPEIAATLQVLGGVSQDAGDLPEAKQYLEESLRMKRSLHGDRDHPGIAAALHVLGGLNQAGGDLPEAKRYLEESLQMKRSLHGDRDHPHIAATLHELGRVSRDEGDLQNVFGRSLRMMNGWLQAAAMRKSKAVF